METTHLIIGGGIAGLALALKLAPHGSVIILCKDTIDKSSSWLAQGGIAAVHRQPDNITSHIEDTIVAGAGLCHPEVVETIIADGPRVVKELQQLGVNFSRENNSLHLFTEGGHSQARVAHVADNTGKSIVCTLHRQLARHDNIKLYERQIVIDLITSDKIAPQFASNSCLGAYVFDRLTDKIYPIRSRYTYLCTGGHGKLYLYTSNPETASGDGIALARRAGCRIANLEFMQFHPTLLFHPQIKNFLISEAVRGEGAVLTNTNGQQFMHNYHHQGSLAPRDIVVRAIDRELKKTTSEHVLLDLSKIDQTTIQRRFPNIYRTCQQHNINPQLIPVIPGAHYSCGGIVTDLAGCTNVDNLFALGENACTGFHGANRLASNSLLEALVLADRVAKHVSRYPNQPTIPANNIPAWQTGKASAPDDEVVVLTHTWDEIRRLMWHYVGIIRSEKRLQRALNRLAVIRQELDRYYWDYQINSDLIEVRNLALVAWLTSKCALSRKESRGTHFNFDYPQANADKKRDTILP